MTTQTPTTATGSRWQILLYRWPMLIWLTALWVLLWGDLTVANVLAGAAIAAILLIVAPMPSSGHAGRLSIPGSLYLIIRFIFDVLHASWQVSVMALNPAKVPVGGVVRVRLRSESDVLLTMTGVFTSLVPGSIIVEAHRLTGTLYVHVLDLPTTGWADGVREIAWEQERRLMYAFSSQEDLARAGLPPRRWWGGPGRKSGRTGVAR